LTKGKHDPTPEEQSSYGTRFARIVGLYEQSIAGNKQAAREANVLLESLRSKYPGRPLADAYHGGIMIFMARDKRSDLQKLRYARKGLKLLDGAVAAAPQDLAIRLIRGKAAYNLPQKQFRRTATAIEDYELLLRHEAELSKFMSPEGVIQLKNELGEAYRNVDRDQEANQTDVSAKTILLGLVAGVTGNAIMDMAGIDRKRQSSRRRGQTSKRKSGIGGARKKR
jgi:hypothetical protein